MPVTELDHTFALFMAREVCDLIVNRDKVLGAAKGLFAQNIRTLHRRQGNTLAAFSREVGYHPKSVMMWAENRQKPRLSTLLVLAYRFGLRAVDLIASHLEQGSIMEGRVLPLCSVQRLKPTLHKHDINVLHRALEDAIRNEQSPPPSVASIGRKLGCHSSFLKKKFPDLTKTISAKYRQYWSIHKSERLFFMRLIVKSRTSEIAARGEYPSWRKVARTLPGTFNFGTVVIEAWQETLRDWGLRPPEPRKGSHRRAVGKI
jgi:AraC-like DNA-binding protein